MSMYMYMYMYMCMSIDMSRPRPRPRPRSRSRSKNVSMCTCQCVRVRAIVSVCQLIQCARINIRGTGLTTDKLSIGRHASKAHGKEGTRTSEQSCDSWVAAPLCVICGTADTRGCQAPPYLLCPTPCRLELVLVVKQHNRSDVRQRHTLSVFSLCRCSSHLNESSERLLEAVWECAVVDQGVVEDVNVVWHICSLCFFLCNFVFIICSL